MKGFSPLNPVTWDFTGCMDEFCIVGDIAEVFVEPVCWDDRPDENSESEKADPDVVVEFVAEVFCEVSGLVGAPVAWGLLLKVKDDATLEISDAPGFRALLAKLNPFIPVCCGCCCWAICCCCIPN